MLSKMSDKTKKELIESFKLFIRLFNELLDNNEMFKKNIAILTLNKNQKIEDFLIFHLLLNVLFKKKHINVKNVF